MRREEPTVSDVGQANDRDMKGSGKVIITCMAVMGMLYGAAFMYTFWPFWQN